MRLYGSISAWVGTMLTYALRFVWIAICLLSSANPADALDDVVACGQNVPGGDVLVASLDCTGTNAYAVVMNNGATLDLAGFTITAALAA